MAKKKEKKAEEIVESPSAPTYAKATVDKQATGDAGAEEIVEEIREIEEPVSTESALAPKVDESHKRFLTLKQSGERNWYVIHTYSGYEEQVADSLKQRIESMDMSDKIFDVIVPKENQIEIKNGKRKIVEKKVFPGYVLVDMIVTDDSWYVVRNTPNVTGFIGFGVRPTPMSKEEIDRIKKRMGVKEPKYQVDYKVGDLVKITDGALKGFEGKIEEVDGDKGKVKVMVNMFGRETPVNLDFLQVKNV